MFGSLFSMVIMLSPLICRMHIYIFQLLSIIIVSYDLFWHNVPYQWKVLSFELVTAHQVFTTLTKPILFLCCQKGFQIIIYLDDILVLVHSKQAGKRACLFCVPY